MKHYEVSSAGPEPWLRQTDRTVPFRASGLFFFFNGLAPRRWRRRSVPGACWYIPLRMCKEIFMLPRAFGGGGGCLFLGSCRAWERLAAFLQHPWWPEWQVFRSAVRNTCSWCERLSCTILAQCQRLGLRKGLCNWPASSDLRTHSSL